MVTDGDMEDLRNLILHMENRLEQFRNLLETIEHLRTLEIDADIILSAPPDNHKVTVTVEEKGEPSSSMLRLMELSDVNNNIEYFPEGDRYRLKVVMWSDR